MDPGLASTTEAELKETSIVTPAQPMQADNGRQKHHSKKLSLNFPILVQQQRRGTDSPKHQSSISPNAASLSDASTPQSQTNPPSSVLSAALTTPLTPPSESLEDGLYPTAAPRTRSTRHKSHARSHTLAHTELYSIVAPQSANISPGNTNAHFDFLPLLASQERRVLELKEELHRAETELQTLKRQWSIHEGNRKRAELRNGGVVKLEVLKSPQMNPPPQVACQRSKGHTRSATLAAGTGLGLGLGISEEHTLLEDSTDADEGDNNKRSSTHERFRKRGSTLEDGHSTLLASGRRSGQRVFSGSRHTRTLSLLASTGKPSVDEHDLRSAKPNIKVRTSNNDISRRHSGLDHNTIGSPSLTRSNSGFGRELNFGKTYKDLASVASRRTIPQGADVLMKHGKVMVDGVRDGLWSFFEDIRQATVGEEATREEDQVDGINRDRHSSLSTAKGKPSPDAALVTDMQGHKTEQSFWKEFGVDTPRRDRKKSADGPVKSRAQKAKTLPGPGPTYTQDEDIRAGRYQSDIGNHPDEPPSQQAEPATSKAHVTETNIDHNAGQPKKKDRTSHSSTDSGDSRDSRNPPSLTMDSPFGGSTRNDTDLDNDTGEDDTWSWKDSDSPTQVRSKTLLTDELSDTRIPGPDDADADDLDASNQRCGHAHKHSHEGYEWHALTR